MGRKRMSDVRPRVISHSEILNHVILEDGHEVQTLEEIYERLKVCVIFRHVFFSGSWFRRPTSPGIFNES